MLLRSQWVSVAAVLALLPALAFAQASRPAGGAGRGAGAKVQPTNPIPAAVKALLREFEEAMRKKVQLPRKRSDYFADAPIAPTPEMTWTALDGKYSQNGVGDAYVKWQLLSAVPWGDEAATKRYIALLKKAPAPNLNPLIEQRGRSEVEGAAAKVQVGEERAFNQKIADILEQGRNQGLAILLYRDELLARLPPSGGRYGMELEELALRVRAGWDVSEQRDRVLADIKKWYTTADAAELAHVVQTLHKVRSAQSDEYPIAIEDFAGTTRISRTYVRLQGNVGPIDDLIATVNTRLRAIGR